VKISECFQSTNLNSKCFVAQSKWWNDRAFSRFLLLACSFARRLPLDFLQTLDTRRQLVSKKINQPRPSLLVRLILRSNSIDLITSSFISHKDQIDRLDLVSFRSYLFLYPTLIAPPCAFHRNRRRRRRPR
jgi:hypothetical protein